MHHGALHVARHLRQARSARRPVLRGDDLRHAFVCAAGRAARAIVDAVTRAAAAIGLRHGPIHAECRVNRAKACSCSKSRRDRSAACARARCASIDRDQSARFPQSAPISALEELLLRHALGEDPARWRARTRASGVMMIPIPRRGVFRGVDGVEAARGVAGHRRRPDHREAGSTAGAAAGGRQLSGIHLRARRARGDVERALRDGARAAALRHRSGIAGARRRANALQSAPWLIPADTRMRRRRRRTRAAAR